MEFYSYLQGSLVACDTTDQILYTIGPCIYMFIFLPVWLLRPFTKQGEVRHRLLSGVVKEERVCMFEPSNRTERQLAGYGGCTKG